MGQQRDLVHEGIGMEVRQPVETQGNDLVRLAAENGRTLGPELAGQVVDGVAIYLDRAELPVLGPRRIVTLGVPAAKIAQNEDFQRIVRDGRGPLGPRLDAKMDLPKTLLLPSHDLTFRPMNG